MNLVGEKVEVEVEIAKEIEIEIEIETDTENEIEIEIESEILVVKFIGESEALIPDQDHQAKAIIAEKRIEALATVLVMIVGEGKDMIEIVILEKKEMLGKAANIDPAAMVVTKTEKKEKNALLAMKIIDS